MINSDLVAHMDLGFSMFAADTLWIRVVQEIDYKDSPKTNKGWVFHMLDAITTLDHRFRIAYLAGGTILSVLIQDVDGASILWQRAVDNFPDDWSVAYRAGYHFLFEAKDCRKAGEMFRKAGMEGAPGWVGGLAGRLFAKLGQYQLARSVILDSMKKFEGTQYYDELKKRLNQLDENYRNPSKKAMIEGLQCSP